MVRSLAPRATPLWLSQNFISVSLATVFVEQLEIVVITATWSGQFSFTDEDHGAKLLEICTVLLVETSDAICVSDDQVFHAYSGDDLRLVGILGDLLNHLNRTRALVLIFTLSGLSGVFSGI